MAYNKKTWLARLGQGLNKFIFNGGSKVTLESAPDVVTQAGTPLSAKNMNDLEDRIDSEFTNVNDAINAISVKIGNLKETSFELASNASYEFDIDYFSTVLISSARSGSSDSSLFFVAPNTVSAIFNNDNPISVSYGSGTHITISNLTARSLGIHIIYMKV